MPRPVLAPLQLNQSGGDGGNEVPLHFRCPISLEVMRDPVILCTGQTYDRSSIEIWIANGNATCPVTMQKLHDLTLIPNHTLRRLIHEWCCCPAAAHLRLNPPLDCSNIRALLADSLHGDLKALRSLRIVAKEDRRNRSVMVDSGVVPVLIAVVFGGADKLGAVAPNPSAGYGYGDDSATTEEALATLALFPLRDSDRLAITQPHRLRLLCCSLNNHAVSMAMRLNVVAVISALSDSKELQELRAVLAMAPGLMEGVVAMVKQGSKAAMKALFSMCLMREGKEAAAAAGAAEAVAGKLSMVAQNGAATASQNGAESGMAPQNGAAIGLALQSQRRQQRDIERAVGTIELLSKSDAGLAEIAGESCRRVVVPALVRLILTVSDRATECSVGSLLAIARSNVDAAACAVQSGVIKELLLLIQSNCTHRAKTKAMALLKLLSDRDIGVQGLSRLPRLLQLPDYGRTDVVPF